MYSNLMEVILDDYKIVRTTHTTYFFEDGSKMPITKFKEMIFPNDMSKLTADVLLKDPEFYKEIREKSPENQRKIKQRFFEDLHNIVIDVVESNKANGVSAEISEKYSIVKESFNFQQYLYFRHIADDRYLGSKVLFDTVKGSISKISPEVYLESFFEKPRPLDAVFEYDPYNITPVKPFVFEGQKINRVNTYIAPEWRKLAVTVPKTPPAVFSEFLKHLFPDVESRRFVISWIKNAILHRSETVLILNGAKGTGKNLLADFLKELVGAENFGRAKKSLIQKEFNAMLEDKRLIFLDEIRIDKAAHTFLKDICNAEHNIEKKGVDANNLTPTYHSILLCNNDISDVYLEWDDRRFSTPNITSVPLRAVFSEEKIQEVVRLLKDPTSIKQIGEFIINYEHDTYSDPFYAFKPERFHQLVKSSLYGWQQIIMEKLSEYRGRPQNIVHIREDARETGVKFPSTNGKIESFLQNYYHRGLFKIGYISKKDRKSMLHISDEFKEYVAGDAISEDDI